MKLLKNVSFLLVKKEDWEKLYCNDWLIAEGEFLNIAEVLGKLGAFVKEVEDEEE